MTVSRSPRAALTTTSLPRFDRLALATLALGSTAAGVAGCHREPFCVDVRAADPQSWRAKLVGPVSCTTGRGETHGPLAYGGAPPVVTESPPPPGAMPAVQPVPLPPQPTGGVARMVQPDPLPAHHGRHRASR